MPIQSVSDIGLIQSLKGESLVSVIGLIQSPKRESLVSNIGLIQSPKGESFVSDIGLNQSPKGESLVSDIGLIQSPKGEPLLSNIVLIQSPKRELLVNNIIIILREKRLPAVHVCRAHNRDSICAQKRAKYELGEPKLDVKDMYMKDILSHLLADAEARSLVSDSFRKMHINDKINVSVKAMCRVAAKMLLNKALQIHREHAGYLLQAARLVQSMELTDKNDFADGYHMAITEPFFYDSAYKLVEKEYALPIDTNGKCITAKNVCTSYEIPRYLAKKPPMKWECSSECEILSDSDVCTIIDLAAAFQKPMRELRSKFLSVDSGCPN